MDKLNIFDVKRKIVRKIKKAVKKNDYKVLHILRASDYPTDDYLYIVVAERIKHIKDLDNYVTWNYNDGLNNGVYTSSLKAAMLNAYNRFNEQDYNKISRNRLELIKENEISLDSIIKGEFSIVRYVEGIPERFHLYKEELEEFRQNELARRGSNILYMYLENLLDEDDDEEYDEEILEKISKDKEALENIGRKVDLTIPSDVEKDALKEVYNEYKK